MSSKKLINHISNTNLSTKQAVKKKFLREKFLATRKKLTPNERVVMNTLIFRMLTHFEIFKNAKKILIYSPINNEVDIFDKLITLKDKELYLPVTTQDTINIIKFIPGQTMSKDEYHVKIPENTIPFSDPRDLDLILTPGIVFHRLGFRIGYGKGHYDRFLKNLNIPTIGLAYHFQLHNDFTPESHDQPINYIITEKEIIFTEY